MPAKKKLKDRTYYWVRRPSYTAENQTSVRPDWEPMMWDGVKRVFCSRGCSDLAPGQLQDIGDEIQRRPGRVVRTLWAPVLANGAKSLLFPLLCSLELQKREVRTRADGPPLRVEVSWDEADTTLD